MNEFPTLPVMFAMKIIPSGMQLMACSCPAVRGIAFAARAAYLAHYKPALQGVFLAFANAGEPAWITKPCSDV